MSETHRRILRIIARLNIGGPATHVALLDRRLRARGWTCLVVHGRVADDEESVEQELERSGVALHALGELGRRVRPWSDAVAFWRLLRLVWAYQPDIVHTHTAKAGALGRAAAAVYNLAHPQRRALIVHTFHGHVLQAYFDPATSRVVRVVERLLGYLTDRTIAISPSQRHDLVDRFKVAAASRTVIIPLGLDLTSLLGLSAPTVEARRALDLPDDALVYAFVGRLVPIKNPELLLHGFSRLLTRYPRAFLIVVGDGDLRPHLERLVATLGVGANVRFLGWRRDLPAIYAATDVVVLTSRNEGTPVAVIEALACARAVIATAVGGVPDVVTPDVSGLLVPSGDADQLVNAMIRLAADPSARQRLGRAGRRFVADAHGVDRLVDLVEQLYRSGLRDMGRSA